MTESQSAEKKRSRLRLHASTWLLGLLVAGALFFFNAGGTSRGRTGENRETCEHGWPRRHLHRESDSPPIGLWPWDAGAAELDRAALAGNLAAAAGILLAALALFEYRRRRVRRFWQITLKDAFAATLLAAGVALWLRGYYERYEETRRQAAAIEDITEKAEAATGAREEFSLSSRSTNHIWYQQQIQDDLVGHQFFGGECGNTWNSDIIELGLGTAAAEYALAKIDAFPLVEAIEIHLKNGPNNFFNIRRLDNLKRLDVVLYETVPLATYRDLSKLGDVPRIHLYVGLISSDTTVHSLTEYHWELIGQINNLERLFVVTWSRLSDGNHIRFLKGLTNLKRLSLRGQIALTDASLFHISQIHRLEELNVDYSPNITNAGVRRLKNLKNLRELDLTNCPNVTDVAKDELLRAIPELVITDD